MEFGFGVVELSSELWCINRTAVVLLVVVGLELQLTGCAGVDVQGNTQLARLVGSDMGAWKTGNGRRCWPALIESWGKLPAKRCDRQRNQSLPLHHPGSLITQAASCSETFHQILPTERSSQIFLSLLV